MSSGVVSFNVTEDGTPTGTALFADLTDSTKTSIIVAAQRNTAVATEVPVAATKTVTDKVVTVVVVVGTVLGVLGATMLPAPDGTVVHIQIMGVGA